jgi:PAS domain S-box-containing protein
LRTPFVPESFAEARKYAERRITSARDLVEAQTVSTPMPPIDPGPFWGERLWHMSDDLFCVSGTDGRLLKVNPAWERALGWCEEDLIGRSPVELVHPEDAGRLAERLGEARECRRFSEVELRYRHADGSHRWLLWSGYRADERWYSIGKDITDRIESERQVRSARDYLLAITGSMAEGLYTLDVDGRLIYMNRAAENMLGWGQDELVGKVMHHAVHYRRPDGSPNPMVDCPMSHVRRDGEVTRVEDDIFVRRDGHDIPVAYTAAPFETEDGVRGSVVVFTDITERKREREELSWLGRVRDALDEDRLELHAQPIVDVVSGAVVQHELLLRLRERDGTLVAPGAFLPAAEEHGTIVDVDRWVVARAIELAARGEAVELNLSARSIGSPSLLDEFRAGLDRTGADPSLIVVELTETALLDEGPRAEVFIERVKALGCKLALDDFGTGYGGFTYLKRLPVDYLKIDVEFVRDLPHNEASQHVVRAVVNLAKGFGQRTVAEGVEDSETLELLRELDVDLAQGYGLGRPAPIDQTFKPYARSRED